MVKTECRRCRFYGPLAADSGHGRKCCNYAWITGRCRSTLPPRDDGRCPGYEPGERAKASPKRHDNPPNTPRRGGKPMKYDGAQLLALYLAGLSDPAIGEQIGAPPRSVCAWRKRHGLAPNVPPGRR